MTEACPEIDSLVHQLATGKGELFEYIDDAPSQALMGGKWSYINEMELSSWLPLGEGGSLGGGINAGAGIEVSSDCSFATSMIQCLRPRILTHHGWRVGGTGSNILSKHVNPPALYIKTTL